MKTKDRIIKLIFRAIDEVNEQLSPELRLGKIADTVLFGKGSVLDSLGLVNLIVATEQKITEDFKVSLVLANEKAISQKNSPFKTVESLANYIDSLMEEKGRE